VRQGVYRIVYEIVDDELVVTVVKTGHRRDVYTETAEQTRLPLSACGGELSLFSDQRIHIDLDHYHSLTLADICPSTAPIVYTVPLQLLAYHTAVLKGTDVDQPRKLAKSVTVE
jgi:glucosamine 6-phosphate synthetase-like amidotransferase/phosphosugar isomerase protein